MNKIYLVIFVTIFISLAYLYNIVNKTVPSLSVNVEKMFVKQAEDFSINVASKVEDELFREEKTLYEFLSSNCGLQKQLNEYLSIIISNTFKYAYMLYRDEKGNFRYLADGSDEMERADFNQLFDVESSLYEKVYTTQKSSVEYQKEIDTLSATYIYPIVVKGKTEAIIIVDFSRDMVVSIVSILEPMEQMFTYVFAGISILILFLIYQALVNYRVKKESFTDALTQVYNRHYLRVFSENMKSEEYQLAILDIDHFKKVNDNYGHDAGDFVLQSVAVLLQQQIRPQDVLIRFGGEEFLLFIKKNKANRKSIVDIAQRIRKVVEKHNFKYENTTLKITVSMGLTLNMERFQTVGEAIRHADEMLYCAKKEGRNRVVFRDRKESNIQNLSAIDEIKEAIEQEKFFCHYQSIHNVQTGKIEKYEALVRYINKEGKIVYPDAFLEVIAKTNIYKDMTKAVIRLVFETIQSKGIHVSMNLNFSDILDNDIFILLQEELQAHLSFTNSLTVELLETEKLENIELVSQRISKLKEYGVKIAIDDFGSGYANFNLFDSFPIDIIKIDGSLIKEINNSVVAFSVVKSISLFAEALDIEIVAEYVETQEILDTLKILDVPYGQGYHLGKPKLLE